MSLMDRIWKEPDDITDIDEVTAAYILGREQGKRLTEMHTVVNLCIREYLDIDAAAMYLKTDRVDVEEMMRVYAPPELDDDDFDYDIEVDLVW